MEFGWTAEQEHFRSSVERFVLAEVEPALAAERDAPFARKAWLRCAEFGLIGLPFPERFGGQGADLVTTALALETFGYACADNGFAFSLGAHMWSCILPILKFGTDDQQQRYLPGLCDGSLIGVQAVTETGSGSDAMAVATTATRVDGGFVLNGSKTFITNAPVADVFVVLAADADATGPSGVAAFVVDRDTPGVEVGAAVAKLGLRSSPMAEVVFRDCRLPESSLLGGPGAGMSVFGTTIEWERTFILASAVGTMRRQLEQSVFHATNHRRFGSSIGTNQAVAHRVADMAVTIEAARLMLYHAAWLKDTRRRAPAASSATKLFLSNAFVDVSQSAFDLHGGYAYMSGTDQERDLRDALASRIYSGTSDIQRNIIARTLGL